MADSLRKVDLKCVEKKAPKAQGQGDRGATALRLVG